jgi:hypothetical protein
MLFHKDRKQSRTRWIFPPSIAQKRSKKVRGQNWNLPPNCTVFLRWIVGTDASFPQFSRAIVLGILRGYWGTFQGDPDQAPPNRPSLFLAAFVLIKMHNRVHCLSDGAGFRPDRFQVFGSAEQAQNNGLSLREGQQGT